MDGGGISPRRAAPRRKASYPDRHPISCLSIYGPLYSTRRRRHRSVRSRACSRYGSCRSQHARAARLSLPLGSRDRVRRFVLLAPFSTFRRSRRAAVGSISPVALRARMLFARSRLSRASDRHLAAAARARCAVLAKQTSAVVFPALACGLSRRRGVGSSLRRVVCCSRWLRAFELVRSHSLFPVYAASCRSFTVRNREYRLKDSGFRGALRASCRISAGVALLSVMPVPAPSRPRSLAFHRSVGALLGAGSYAARLHMGANLTLIRRMRLACSRPPPFALGAEARKARFAWGRRWTRRRRRAPVSRTFLRSRREKGSIRAAHALVLTPSPRAGDVLVVSHPHPSCSRQTLVRSSLSNYRHRRSQRPREVALDSQAMLPSSSASLREVARRRLLRPFKP